MDDFDVDCLIIGNNQMEFASYVKALRNMGKRSSAFRDVSLSFYEEDGQVVSCRDYYNQLYEDAGSLPSMSYDNILSATIAYLGSFLHQHGLRFEFINSYQEERQRLIDILTTKRVRAVAITTTYYVFALPILEIMECIKEHAPDVKVIVGGPHINTQHKVNAKAEFEFLLRKIGADFYVISSQGERALVDILSALRDDRPTDGIANSIAVTLNGTSELKQTSEETDLANHPIDWTLFRPAILDGQRRMVMTRTAVSCPFSCSFCSFPAHAGAYRYLDPELICRELDQLEDLGEVSSVTFIDDTFNVPINRFEQILRILIDRKYSFRWNCNLRLQHVNEPIIAMLKEAGCEGVFLGLESGSDTILKNMNKKSTSNSYLMGLEWLKRYGIMSYASFIIGFPGETRDTVMETVDLIETGTPDFFRAQLWYYDKMTPIHDREKHFGLKNSQFEWEHATMTAPAAGDWIEFMHANIRNSVWLPQNDFDYPSLFNLLSRGWSVDEIKVFLRKFNEKVRHGLGLEESQPLKVMGGARSVQSVEFNF